MINVSLGERSHIHIGEQNTNVCFIISIVFCTNVLQVVAPK